MVNGCSIHIVGILQSCPMGESYTNSLHQKILMSYERYHLPEEVFSNCPCISSESWLKSNLNFFKMSAYWKSQWISWKLEAFQPKWWDIGIWKKEFGVETYGTLAIAVRVVRTRWKLPPKQFLKHGVFYLLSGMYMLQFYSSSSLFQKVSLELIFISQSVHYIQSPLVCSGIPLTSRPLSDANVRNRRVHLFPYSSLLLALPLKPDTPLTKQIVITSLLCGRLQTICLPFFFNFVDT